MTFKLVTYCEWDTFQFLEEKHIPKNYTLSISDGKDIELMIFLQKKKSTKEYEVRVYTTATEFDYFEFVDFTSAQDFIVTLRHKHPEYKERPRREKNKSNYEKM